MILLTIITKPQCPMCDQVKTLLNTNRITYDNVEIGKDITREEVLRKFPDAKVVPIIMLYDQRMGGIAELEKLVEQGLV